MESEEQKILKRLLSNIDDDDEVLDTSVLTPDVPETSDDLLKPTVEDQKDAMNEMMVNTLLEKTSKYITSKSFKEEMGTPTCIDVSTNFIAIGTSLGHVVLFDHFQQVRCIIGKGTQEENGRVYSLSVSADSEWLLVGHHSGVINLWNIDNQKKLKHFQNQSKSPITYLEFLDEKKSKFICCSLDSVVLLYSLSKVLGMMLSDVDIVMTKTAERGIIMAVAPLKSDAKGVHPISEASLIACGTFSHIIILSMQEVSHVLFQLKAPHTSSRQLPYFSWRPLISTEKEDGKYKLFDPVLAVAWGNYINLVLVSSSKKDSQLNFKIVTAFKSQDNIIGITWVDSTSILYLSSTRGYVLFDPFKAEDIESRNLSVELSCHNKFSLHENTDLIQSYHNSMCCFKEHVYTLGWETVHSTHMLSWEARVNRLLDKSLYIEAIGLIINFIQGKIQSGVKLPRNQLKAKTVLHMKMEEVLLSFVRTSLQSPRSSEKDASQVAIISIDCCFSIGRSDFIFTGLYPIFKQYNQEGLVFENLIPFIVGGKVSKLKPEIIQQIFKYYEVHNPNKIEELIPYLDMSQIDFHIIVKICIKHLLYDTLFHIYITALKDYISPFEILIDIFIEDDKQTDTERYKIVKRQLGGKLLEYMAYIFNEKEYLTDSHMHRDKAAALKDDLLKCLLSSGENGRSRLFSFLKQECEPFLSTMSIAFDKLAASSPTLQQWMNVLTGLIFEKPQLGIFNKQLPSYESSLVYVFTLKYVLSKGLTTPLNIEFTQILKTLEPYPQLQYDFFNVFLDNRADKNYILPPNLGEKMLDLMCQFEPLKVLPWIQKYDSSYRLEHAIQITSKYEATITTYCRLLEKIGEIRKALKAILDNIEKKIALLETAIPKVDEEYADNFKKIAFPNSNLNTQIDDISKLLSFCFTVCKRNTDKFNEEERNEIWIGILETVLRPVHILEAQITDHQLHFEIPDTLKNFGKSLTRPQLIVLKEQFHRILGYVIDNALLAVSPDFILDRITKQGKSYLRDFKTIFNLLIEDFRYESIMINEVSHLIKEDAHRSMETLIKKKRTRVPQSQIKM